MELSEIENEPLYFSHPLYGSEVEYIRSLILGPVLEWKEFDLYLRLSILEEEVNKFP